MYCTQANDYKTALHVLSMTGLVDDANDDGVIVNDCVTCCDYFYCVQCQTMGLSIFSSKLYGEDSKEVPVLLTKINSVKFFTNDREKFHGIGLRL